MAKTIKQTEERVSEVKRRAEEAVSDVKRQAVIELQKAVRAAEEKANEAVAGAHVKMEKAVLEARRVATEETIANTNVQTDSNEVSKTLILFPDRLHAWGILLIDTNLLIAELLELWSQGYRDV